MIHEPGTTMLRKVFLVEEGGSYMEYMKATKVPPFRANPKDFGIQVREMKVIRSKIRPMLFYVEPNHDGLRRQFDVSTSGDLFMDIPDYMLGVTQHELEMETVNV